MAEVEDQTKTGGFEQTGGTTGVTGATGADGTTAPTPKTEPATDPATPDAAPPPPPPPQVVVIQVENPKTVEAAPPVMVEPVGLKTWDCVVARRLFVMKVFGMVGAMLAVVVFMTLLPFVSQNFRIFAIRHDWIFYIAYLFFIITYISLVCVRCIRMTKPYNYIMTGVLVFSMGWMTIGITVQSDAEIVLLALLMTSICSAATIVFAMKTNFDMTKCGPILCLISLVMFVFFIVALIAALAFHVKWLYTIYAGLMTILMMAYLAYDVQMMMGGRRHEISVNDPYYAAIQIFVDIVMMFWYMVQAIGG